MNILVVSNMYPNKVYPNNGLFVQQQLKELAKQGYTVKVIVPVPWVPPFFSSFKKDLKEYASIPSSAVIDNVEIFFPRVLSFPGLKFYHYRSFLNYLSIKKIVEKLFSTINFDIIHCHATLPNGYTGLLTKKKYNKKLTITIHGGDLQVLINNINCKKQIHKILKETDNIIVVSNKLKCLLFKTFSDIEESKVSVISNGIELEKFKQQADFSLLETYKNQTILLSVGNLIKIKGHEYVLKALPELLKKQNNLIYLLVGKGTEKQYLENLIKHLHLENKVVFLGSIPYKQVLKYMQICDIFVLPSYNEGFGIVYLEAMAFGKPVIGCRTQGIEDFVKDHETGFLVQPQSSEEVYNCISKLLDSPELTQKVANAGKNLVLNKYTWRENVKQYISVYEDLLS